MCSPIHILEDTISLRILLHQLNSKPFRQCVYMALVRIINPCRSNINNPFSARQWDGPCLASNPVSGFKNNAGKTCLLDIVSRLETTESGTNHDYIVLVFAHLGDWWEPEREERGVNWVKEI